MTERDKSLGMNSSITRRDLLQGVGAIAGAAMIPGQALADAVLAQETNGSQHYPPNLTGMRGNHAGSFEVAHALAREGKTDWGPVQTTDKDVYDLVVVGAGFSGLAAAYFYRKDNPGARILLLDNHDDFGGHAKRNEFQVSGRNVIGYGGSQSMEEPSNYPRIVKRLLRELDIDLDTFHEVYDHEFFKRHDLSAGVFFDKKNWGSDKLVRCDVFGFWGTVPLADSPLSTPDAVQAMPLSAAAREQMLHLLTLRDDQIPDVPRDEKEDYLETLSYKRFLQKHIGITEQQVFDVFQQFTADSGVGIETTSAATAMLYVLLPGIEAAGIRDVGDFEPYIHHFPDGNASVARLLVRKLIPAVADGDSMMDIVKAPFDYSRLDCADAAVRLRLNSTVTRVQHDGPADSSKQVNVEYVNDGVAHGVRAKNCILACYHSAIPSICPELAQPQRDALRQQVKTPILYTNVALKNWRAWKELGVGAVAFPNGYHVNAMLDFPVSMGGYDFAENPDEPIVVHMEKFPHKPNAGLGRKDQYRMGRHELLSTPFETIELSIRQQLADVFGGAGFDPSTDIEGITVNRWAHGYSYYYSYPDDPWYEDPDDERYAHVKARQRLGRIAIANSDAGARAMLQTAVEQAYRAVEDLS